MSVRYELSTRRKDAGCAGVWLPAIVGAMSLFDENLGFGYVISYRVTRCVVLNCANEQLDTVDSLLHYHVTPPFPDYLSFRSDMLALIVKFGNWIQYYTLCYADLVNRA